MENLETLTAVEAAVFLQMNEKTVRNLLRRRQLPGVRVGNRWRLTRVGLEAFLRGEWPARAVAKP